MARLRRTRRARPPAAPRAVGPRGVLVPGVVLCVAAMLAGCALLVPPRWERVSALVPLAPEPVPGYVAGERVARYEAHGLRIEVEHLTDRELHEEIPVEPPLGEPAILPYTYGDRVDPALGYVPSRFTVFRVTVHNLGLAKVELDPTRCLLTTDRGDRLPAYGLHNGEGVRSLEAYFRSRQGGSGNEHFRFTQRMALVSSHNYLSGEPIQRGESYGGYVVFDPLDDEVSSVRLHLHDIVVRSNAYGKPLETLDLTFSFRHEVRLEAWRGQGARARSASLTRARLRAPSRVVGELAGDITREPAAIDAFIRTRLDELNTCFETGYVAGTAVTGEVVVDFTVLAHGGVESADLAGSTVGGEAVGTCVVERIRRWNLGPAIVVPSAAEADSSSTPAAATRPAATPTRVHVTSTIDFAEADAP